MKSSARILVVDDDDHVRDALVDELSGSYAVEAVGSAGEAFDLLTLGKYDVVISDLKMPEHDGIEVLEFARTHQGDAVRVLLTGYLDERAQRALLTPDAPYKVGKPWHDEIEVIVKRGLEQRETTRRLNASFEDALRLSTLDAELAAATSPLEMTDVLVRRCLGIEGVISCAAVTRAGDRLGSRKIPIGTGWQLDLPLDAEGEIRLQARGVGEGARQLVSYMAHRAQRACGVLEPRDMQVASLRDHGTRLNQLVRQATLGALTSALLHDLASAVQNLSTSLGEVTALVAADPEASAAAKDASDITETVVQLFVNMRKFIREGDVQRKPLPVSRLIDRAKKMTGGYLRDRAELVVHPIPEVNVEAAESLMMQVLSNLLRNAANASPPGGTIDLKTSVFGDEVIITVTDDGPGVAPAIADEMFEPFTTSSQSGTGLGLAISAYVMQLHGGRIAYRKHPARGAVFEVCLPKSAP